MLEKSLTTITKLKVRFHECDPLQIVWHGNYLKYFEEGREDFGREHGISYLDAKAEGFSTPIVKSVCEHKLPLKYSDSFTVETTFKNSDAAKINFSYKIYKGDNLICTGKTTQVFLDKNRELVLNNPPFFLDWKKKMKLL
ncbi:acyl-CoA thioesterase [Salegentibacter mishustinae]|uniref:4-hydroxybenzoyl-CoA thioesterase n=1 Tax=Salegentibacter mishustinae TaxID=270918 RepID=A0A0Q9Z5W8_9FLAO|nr:thioesterase family protein [Salegentibacter mishustinae]KRG27225.1 4-hydroxybenzoyl-CoA thioesterase [Salegentibacter mishustinae]PNW21459.1 4-hydroxybenzoyl-CoA thioesterase [Salegentibacter mishustinae]PZX62592.1 acyl-CoA thioester hydrolase [Salegentibacter mishustinae]GGW96933.1 4-hydroxybenzoyl-CoA thioesterase [Salegentibacter mishustinae]